MRNEDFESKMEEVSKFDTGIYFWIWAIENGRRILLGPFNSEDEAHRRGYSVLSVDFEVIPLKTRSVVMASRILRSRVADETKDMGQTFKRFKHKIKGDER